MNQIQKARNLIKKDPRTYRQLAKDSGVCHMSIWQFAAGKKSLTLESFFKLMTCYGLSIK